MDDFKFEFKAIDFGPVWLLGKKTTVAQGKTATKFVKEYRTGGTKEYLDALDEVVSPKGDMIIWMGEYDGATKSFTEIPGVFVNPGTVVREDLTYRELPACKMGILEITGSTRSLSRGAHNKLVKLMSEAGYAPDYSYGYSMEYYSYEKYEKDNTEYTFAYYLPCKAK